uniref:FZ domain-containing protein n=1 Tax=Chromera velia CCMP2878 TaxID=1169474 RepID=A0A0G4ICR3_9ALVE|eukprot:Cvel_13226.t1-p1 / transcript=Cvel_13226.t1 / gene=Cvel_13226 / organism=Chromera_velia_CCMP2878 / gene_product=hypothetical protein / transcript_product=hypothetical protein / location=Cvel_scaffold895:58070-59108(-) / protein_length=201 / sequence_SO=supercontig / SO=protein_coding / is_pseudo=false
MNKAKDRFMCSAFSPRALLHLLLVGVPLVQGCLTSLSTTGTCVDYRGSYSALASTTASAYESDLDKTIYSWDSRRPTAYANTENCKKYYANVQCPYLLEICDEQGGSVRKICPSACIAMTVYCSQGTENFGFEVAKMACEKLTDIYESKDENCFGLVEECAIDGVGTLCGNAWRSAGGFSAWVSLLVVVNVAKILGQIFKG